MVNFTLPFTTNNMNSISTLQTFRSRVVINHLCRPMAFSSLNLYDTPGLAPRMNVLFWGPDNFPVLKQGYLVERLKSSFRKFYGRYGHLIQQYEVSLSRILNDILTLDQQWLPNRSDFPPISWPWYRAWPSPNYEWFPRSICNGCGMPAGNAYPSGHLVSPPLVTCLCSETRFLELAVSLLDFSLWIPLSTFSILPCELNDELLYTIRYRLIFLIILPAYICSVSYMTKISLTVT